ncbi:integrase core domain-containing protein [Kitasatospora sp. NPDC088351]
MPGGGSLLWQARIAVFAWLTWYNRKRRHSALGYRS